MLYITCPYCGKRDEAEFTYGGENKKRPNPEKEISDEKWAKYLFMHSNPKGKFEELWYHSSGCRKWFLVNRDTVSYKISSSKKLSND